MVKYPTAVFCTLNVIQGHISRCFDKVPKRNSTEINIGADLKLRRLFSKSKSSFLTIIR